MEAAPPPIPGGPEGNGVGPTEIVSAGPTTQRFEVEFVERSPSGFSLPQLFDGDRVFITNEGTGVAMALEDLLRQRGVSAEVCVDPPDDARVIINLDGLRPMTHEDEALAVNHTVFRRFTRLAPHVETRGGALVTVQDTGGDFGLSAQGLRV